MTPTLPRNILAQIKMAANVGQVIQRYVQLKPGGADTLTGLCPFHSEKSPSLKVHPKAGYYHCFGCGAAGDSIAFLSRIEHLTFPSTVKLLADQYGISLEPVTDHKAEAHRRRAAAELAQECAWYWTELRSIYTARFETVKLFAFSVAADESAYQFWGRRALRWGRIVGKLNRTPIELMNEYRRIRNRPATARIVRQCRETDKYVAMVFAGLAEEKLQEDQVMEILRIGYRGGRAA